MPTRRTTSQVPGQFVKMVGSHRCILSSFAWVRKNQRREWVVLLTTATLSTYIMYTFQVFAAVTVFLAFSSAHQTTTTVTRTPKVSQAPARAALAVTLTCSPKMKASCRLCSTQSDKTKRTPHCPCEDGLESMPTRCTTSQVPGQCIKMVGSHTYLSSLYDHDTRHRAQKNICLSNTHSSGYISHHAPYNYTHPWFDRNYTSNIHYFAHSALPQRHNSHEPG
jgi:hypothetical protein